MTLKVVMRNLENTPLDMLSAAQSETAKRLGFVKYTVDTPEGYTIAECNSEKHARLITASPELLDTLKELAEAVAKIPPTEKSVGLAERAHEAFIIIAKAEGRE